MLDVLLDWYPRDRMHAAIYTAHGHLHLDTLRADVAPARYAAERSVSEQTLAAITRLRENWSYPRRHRSAEPQGDDT
jgi:hypothetical protein